MHSPKPWEAGEHPVQRFKNELDSMFSRYFSEPFLPMNSLWQEANAFVPKCNVKEAKDEYIIEVEVPGVDTEDISIELEGTRMTIAGERKSETKSTDSDNKVHVKEQSYGAFFRAFSLPDNVSTDKIKAESQNGVLFIHIPKSEQKDSRKIDIH